MATNAAKIFGMYPRKGAIVEGADADLVIFDPESKVVIHAREMHSRADYDPFEGFEVTGWPAITISRGDANRRQSQRRCARRTRRVHRARTILAKLAPLNSLASRSSSESSMDEKIVALAGGSGFIGRAIARRLLAGGGITRACAHAQS